MTITVIFFAALRDIVGCSEQQFEFTGAQLSVAQFTEELLARFPRLTMEGVRVALNEEFVERESIIVDGDVVALIPPVSGG